MSGNDEQDELDDELEQEQDEMNEQEKELKERQKKMQDAEMSNLKRSEGASEVVDPTDDEEETLG